MASLGKIMAGIKLASYSLVASDPLRNGGSGQLIICSMKEFMSLNIFCMPGIKRGT